MTNHFVKAICLTLATAAIIPIASTEAHPAYQTVDASTQAAGPTVKHVKHSATHQSNATAARTTGSYFTDRTARNMEKIKSDLNTHYNLSSQSVVQPPKTVIVEAAPLKPVVRRETPVLKKPTAEVSKRISALMSSVDTKMAAQNYSGAINDLDEAIKLTPNDARLWLSRGALKAGTKKLPGALADVSEGIRLSPNDADSYGTRCMVEIELKDYRGAMADANKSLQINPKRADSYAHRATCKRALGDKAGADLDDKEFDRLKN